VTILAVASISLMAYDYLMMLPDEVPSSQKREEKCVAALTTIRSILFSPCIDPICLDDSHWQAFQLGNNSLLSNPISRLLRRIHLDGLFVLYRVAAWFELVGIVVAELILLMRTYAIWGQSRKILYVLILLSSIVIPCAVVMEIDLSTLTFPHSPFPTIIPCISSGGKSLLYIDYALVLGIEFVVVLLTIWIGVRQWQHEFNPLATVLYRDAIKFSSILFVTSVANVVLLAKTPAIPLHLLLLGPQRVLHSVLTSRIILHLRIVSNQQHELETAAPTEMDFIHPPEDLRLDQSCNVEALNVISGDTRDTDTNSMAIQVDIENHSASTGPNPV